MESSLKKKIRLGAIILAVLALLLIMFFAGRAYQKQVPSEAEKYLQDQVELYQQEIQNWENRFTALSAEKGQLEQNVVDLEKQLKSIREYYDKKVITVKSYSYPELEQFFTDRYPD